VPGRADALSMARLHRVLATLALLVAATALCAAPALARKHDHDKLPDRWERKFHLSTKKNDANRDRDRDGLSNYGEYRSHTNPRKKDSDHDGRRDGREDYDRDKLKNRDEIRFGFDPGDKDSDNDGTKDGKENAGKITALTGSSITIRLAAGGKLNAGLAVDCTPASRDDSSGAGDTGDDPAENPADDPETDDSGADDPETDGEDGYNLSASAAQDDDRSQDDEGLDDAEFDKQFEAELAGGQTCDASSLKRGSLVHEATVDRSGPSPVVTAITLVRR
jgi:hypothetical protein